MSDTAGETAAERPDRYGAQSAAIRSDGPSNLPTSQEPHAGIFVGLA